MKKVIIFSLILFTALTPRSNADFWGADIPILANILTQSIAQVKTMIQVLGNARDTLGVLQEMNRGVKEVLRLADTAHIPLPPQVYENAKKIDQATATAEKLYGVINGKAPAYTQTNFKSGVEGLYLSEDAIDYSTFLDDQGNKVKAASVVASQATATRLTAETLGVLLHAVSHSNRLEAKQLEISSTKRLEDTSKDNANYQSFVETQTSIENEMKKSSFSSLNDISSGKD